MSFFRQYGKSLAAVVGAVVMGLYVALSDGRVSATEWALLVQAGAVAVTVYLAPMVPGARWVKNAMAAVGAVGEALVLVLPGGLTGQEWVGLLVAVGTVLGVAGMPAVSGNGVANARRLDVS